MFTKIFFLGLLTLLVCQNGVNANSDFEVEKLSFKELVDKVKELYSQLQELVSGVIGDALGSLNKLLDVLRELKDKYLQSGIDGINSAINDVIQYIKESTDKAKELGIDISECVADHQKQISELGEKLIDNVKTCVTDIVENAEETLQDDIVGIKEIVANVTAIPGKLAKCFVGFKPLSCLSNLLKESSQLAITIPKEVASTVTAANSLINNLPVQLTACGNYVASIAASTSQNIISDISTCVEDKLSENSVFLERNVVSDLIKQIRELIAQLQELTTGVVAEALTTLKHLLSDVNKLVSQVTSEGLAAISGGINDVYDFIKNTTEHAMELGEDISVCIAGREDILEQLSSELSSTFTSCVSNSGKVVISTIQNSIKSINELVAQTAKVPIKLTKCLVSLRPIKCLENLLNDVNTLLTTLKEKIQTFVDEATTLTTGLSDHLQQCVSITVEITSSQTQKIISEIRECTDEIFAEDTRRNSLQDLIEQVKETIGVLNKLVSDTIADAISTLVNLISNLNEQKDQLIAEGAATISSAINSAIEQIEQLTQKANEVGGDISSCTEGVERKLDQLSTKLTNTQKQCVDNIVDKAVSSIQHDLSALQTIVKEITHIPFELSKCLINLKPIKCVQNLLNRIQNMVSIVGEQVASIVEDATVTANAVPSQLVTCTATIADLSVSSVAAIISEVGTCANKIIDGITG